MFKSVFGVCYKMCDTNVVVNKGKGLPAGGNNVTILESRFLLMLPDLSPSELSYENTYAKFCLPLSLVQLLQKKKRLEKIYAKVNSIFDEISTFTEYLKFLSIKLRKNCQILYSFMKK